jgi:hypothetical protein
MFDIIGIFFMDLRHILLLGRYLILLLTSNSKFWRQIRDKEPLVPEFWDFYNKRPSSPSYLKNFKHQWFLWKNWQRTVLIPTSFWWASGLHTLKALRFSNDSRGKKLGVLESTPPRNPPKWSVLRWQFSTRVTSVGPPPGRSLLLPPSLSSAD